MQITLRIVVPPLMALVILLCSLSAVADEWVQQDRQFNDQYRSGQYAEAKRSAEQALATAQRSPASNAAKARQVTSLNALALVNRAEGDDDAAAEALLKRALVIAIGIFPANHPNIVAIQKNLVALESDQQQQAVADILAQAQSLNEQALAYHARAEYQQAAEYYQQALPLIEKHIGSDSIEAARIMSGLADTYAGRKQFADAEALYQKVLAIYKPRADAMEAQGKILNEMGVIQYLQRNFEQAEPLFERALVALEAALGPHHPDLLPTLDNLVTLHRRAGSHSRNSARAEELRWWACELRKSLKSSQH